MRNYKKIQTEKNTVTKIVCNKCKMEYRRKRCLQLKKDGDIFRTKTENSIDLISVRNVMIPG